MLVVAEETMVESGGDGGDGDEDGERTEDTLERVREEVVGDDLDLGQSVAVFKASQSVKKRCRSSTTTTFCLAQTVR